MKREASDIKMLIVTNAFMLLLLPAIVFLLCVFVFGKYIAPELVLPFFLLAAMPVGMTTPFLVDLVGGNKALSLILTITTSLLAPLSVPFITKLFFGTTLAVDTLGMFRNLLLIIFVPFLLALVAKKFLPTAVVQVNKHSRPYATILLGLLIAGAVAAQSKTLLQALSNPQPLLGLIVLLYIFFFFLHVLGYFITYWRSPADRQTISTSLTYMNFTLAIFLAVKYFPSPNVVLPLVLSILPWATVLPIWQWVTKSLGENARDSSLPPPFARGGVRSE